jgi:uncharacterized Zn finger protein (UPF0148 family)
MFEELIKELRRYERGHSVAITLPLDENGFLDRTCPSKSCGSDFKILLPDSDPKNKRTTLFCPICKHEAAGEEFATVEQVKYARQAALGQFKRTVGDALERGARGFNQKQKPGFITLSLSVTRDRTPTRLPRAIGESMEQRFQCASCDARYSSIGAAYFCPSCGNNSVLSTFDQTLKQVRETLGLLPLLAEASKDDKDAAENASRLVLEQSLTKLVGGFERFTEALFSKTPAAQNTKVKRGAFQRLDEASDLWKGAIGKGYGDIILPGEFTELKRAFQRRHLIAHCDGVVDADYVVKSGDQDLCIGQRIRIKEPEILRAVHLLQTLSSGLRKEVTILGVQLV